MSGGSSGDKYIFGLITDEKSYDPFVNYRTDRDERDALFSRKIEYAQGYLIGRMGHTKIHRMCEVRVCVSGVKKEFHIFKSEVVCDPHSKAKAVLTENQIKNVTQFMTTGD